jgi:hypothetical protein
MASNSKVAFVTNGARLVALLILCLGTTCLCDQESAIQRAKRLYADAQNFRKCEIDSNRSVRDRQACAYRRREAFKLAAIALHDHMRLGEKDSVPVLVALFTSALCWEGAGEPKSAKALYEQCLKHPAILNPSARFDSKLIRELLPDCISRTSLETSRRANALEGDWRVRHRGKPPISIAELDPVDAEKPYSFDETAVLLSRNVEVGGEPLAESIGDALLKDLRKYPREPVRVDKGQREGIVLFGVSGNELLLNRLADWIVEYRKLLRNRYFDRANSRRVLYVYANLSSDDDEALSTKLSKAVHFRGFEGMEGYYSSLDHSLVVRRGLVDREGRFFLGSIQHELIHAVIEDDFSVAPLWLNEGLACMHEEMSSGEPVDNYRLYFLKACEKTRCLPSLASLFKDQLSAYAPVRTSLGGKNGWVFKSELSSGSNIVSEAVGQQGNRGQIGLLSFVTEENDTGPQEKQQQQQQQQQQKRKAGDVVDDGVEKADGTLLFIAHARYLCMFLNERDDEGKQLRQIYRRLRTAGSGLQGSDTFGIIQEVTGLSRYQLEDEFQLFIRSRSTAKADIRWRSVSNRASSYVNRLRLPAQGGR